MSTFPISRRGMIKAGATAALAAAAIPVRSQTSRKAATPGYRIRNKRIRQSIMGWTFNPMPAEQLIATCADIGLTGIEGIGRQFYPAARKAGLEISLVGSHGFAKGPNDPANHAMCIEKLIDGINVAKRFGAKRVITFVGMESPNIDRDQAIANCVKAWKQVVGHAEKNGIMICLEHLNSVDDSHPMKGHPGYQGDDLDFCVEAIRKVGSPNLKLLFDVYHVQIMHGDIIRNIRTLKEYIGHYHTAGNPGRAELDDTQEINYPAVMRAILETGFNGFVAQEFIPNWEDKEAALRHAAEICDV
ncbi:MAG: sugar phosphate isomerase/epimerase [Verrucomicrobiota bacterium]|nr:sugar phosphate isomerase/epimerase [Verrucomicrobiota bacterium]